MTNDELVEGTLSDVGKLPGARLFWGPRPPAPPYFVYESRPVSFFADSTAYAELPRYRVRLYQGECDEAVVRRFQDALAVLGTFVRHADEIDEGLFITTYDLNLVRGKK